MRRSGDVYGPQHISIEDPMEATWILVESP